MGKDKLDKKIEQKVKKFTRTAVTSILIQKFCSLYVQNENVAPLGKQNE